MVLADIPSVLHVRKENSDLSPLFVCKENAFILRLVIHILVRDHAQNTTNSAISLVAYNVIPYLIGPSARALITSIMYHMGQGAWPCPFPVTGNGHLGMIPNVCLE